MSSSIHKGTINLGLWLPFDNFDKEYPDGVYHDMAAHMAKSIALFDEMAIMDLGCLTGNLTVAILLLAKKQSISIKMVAVGVEPKDCKLARDKLVKNGLATTAEAKQMVEFCPKDDEERLYGIKSRHSPEGYNIVCGHSAIYEDIIGVHGGWGRVLDDIFFKLLNHEHKHEPRILFGIISNKPIMCGINEVTWRVSSDETWNVHRRRSEYFADADDGERALAAMKVVMGYAKSMKSSPWVRVIPGPKLAEESNIPEGAVWRDTSNQLERVLKNMWQEDRLHDPRAHVELKDYRNQPTKRDAAKEQLLKKRSDMQLNSYPGNLRLVNEPDGTVTREFEVKSLYPFYNILELGWGTGPVIQG